MRWLVVTAAAVGLGMIVQSWVPLLLIPLGVTARSVNRELTGGRRKRDRRWADEEVLRLLSPPFRLGGVPLHRRAQSLVVGEGPPRGTHLSTV
jgi:hypothetical protein